MQNNEQVESIYINKIQNIVGIALHGLFENIVYLYENKSSFDDKKEIDNLIKRYVQILEYTDESTSEELDDLIYHCVLDRTKYKEKALVGLHGSYNLDFQTDALELLDKANGIFDESNIETFDDNVSKDYLYSLIEQNFEDINDFDVFSLSKLLSVTAITDNHYFVKAMTKNIKVLPSNLIETFLNNLKIKSHAIVKTYKAKEFTNAPLTQFDFYFALFTAQNQMIVFLTFFEEVKKLFSDDLLTKDNFFALKKVVLENDDVFLENISAKNDDMLDSLIDENDSINASIKEHHNNKQTTETNPLHQYVDFLEEVLFEDIHYFMQSTENATMGINVKEQILTTLDNLSQPSMTDNESFNDFFHFLSTNEKKLTFSQKLIFYKAVSSLIFSQIKFLGELKGGIIIDTKELVKATKNSYKAFDLEETKQLTAFILD